MHVIVLPESNAADVLIRARDLTKRFGRLTAVDGVDFDVAHGEAFGFLGPNGAGKSSTMRMIGWSTGGTSGCRGPSSARGPSSCWTSRSSPTGPTAWSSRCPAA